MLGHACVVLRVDKRDFRFLSAQTLSDALNCCLTACDSLRAGRMYEDQADTLRGYQRALFKGAPSEVPEATATASPITYAADVAAPLLVQQGANDTRCPRRQMVSLPTPRFCWGHSCFRTFAASS
eukprot:COSAG04_NODE_12570_length_646_cov_0.941499_2_plen_124_part_01